MSTIRRALTLFAGAVLVCAAPAALAAPAKKPPTKKAGTLAVSAPPKPRIPPPPMEITCGAPLKPVKVEKKTWLKLPGRGGPKLPEICVLARFKDPVFPPSDPNSTGKSAVGLFGGSGPVEAKWLASIDEIQKVADEIADAGPRPTVRARVMLSSQNMAEANAIFEGKGGDGGVIVLSTRLIQSLRDLSIHVGAASPEASDALAQDYVRFIVAHEYAHLVLNHPQQLDGARKNYQRIGQALQLAGTAYAVMNQLKSADAAYAEKRREAKESAGVLMAATFVGDVAATEGTRFLFPIFNRSVERDADMLAVDILDRAENANPGQGVEGLKIFYDQNKENIKKNAALSDEAKKSAAQAAAKIADIAPEFLNEDKDELARTLKLAAITISANFALRKLEEHRMMIDAHLHDSPDERDELVTDYLSTFYGKTQVIADAPKPSAFAGVIKSAPSAAVKPSAAEVKPALAAVATRKVTLSKIDFKKIGAEVDGYVATEDAKAAMARGDLLEARRLIDLALRSPIKGTIDVQLLAGGIAQAEGRHDVAIEHFRAVLAAGHNAPHIFHSIAQSQRLKGDNAGALKTLADGVTKTGQLREFILERIDIHRTLNDEKALIVDLEACRALQDPQLTSLCEREAAPRDTSVAETDGNQNPAPKSMLGKMVEGAGAAVAATAKSAGKKPN